MTITVHYLAQLRRATGRASERIDLDEPATLASLLTALARRHGEGLLRPTVLAFVNDAQVGRPEDVVLRDGDSVTFLSPIAGGAS
jgi:molybdopterin converting factor small subunit